MAKQLQGQDAMKFKVQRVREVVPHLSNEKIQLVLHFYDNDEELAIQALLNDGASDALKEWKRPDIKKKSKKKKSHVSRPLSLNVKTEKEIKNDADSLPTDEGTPSVLTPQNASGDGWSNGKLGSESENVPSPVGGISNPIIGVEHPVTFEASMVSVNISSLESVHSVPVSSLSNLIEPNQPAVSSVNILIDPPKLNVASSDDPVASEVTESKVLKTKSSSGANKVTHPRSKRKQPKDLHHKIDPPKNNVEDKRSETVTVDQPAKHVNVSGMELDLKKVIVNMDRAESLFNEEFEKSQKTISMLFDNLRTILNEREAELIFELDKSKKTAIEWVSRRRKTAAVLKEKSDRIHSLKPAEQISLKAELKSFVTEKRHDDEVSSMSRFTCDEKKLVQYLKEFGTVGSLKRQHLISTSSSTATDSISHVLPTDEKSPLSVPKNVQSVYVQTESIVNNANCIIGEDSTKLQTLSAHVTGTNDKSAIAERSTASKEQRRQWHEKKNRSNRVNDTHKEENGEYRSEKNYKADVTKKTNNSSRSIAESSNVEQTKEKLTSDKLKSESKMDNVVSEKRENTRSPSSGGNRSSERSLTSTRNNKEEQPKSDNENKQKYNTDGQQDKQPRRQRGGMRGGRSDQSRQNWNRNGYVDEQWYYGNGYESYDRNNGYENYDQSYRYDDRQWTNGREIYNSQWGGREQYKYKDQHLPDKTKRGGFARKNQERVPNQKVPANKIVEKEVQEVIRTDVDSVKTSLDLISQGKEETGEIKGKDASIVSDKECEKNSVNNASNNESQLSIQDKEEDCQSLVDSSFVPKMRQQESWADSVDSAERDGDTSHGNERNGELWATVDSMQ